MSKGKGKGKGGKNKGKGGGPSTAELESRAYIPRTGEQLAVVIRILGGNHLECMCADGLRRTIRIPGKIRRRVWVRTGDLVVIEPWHDLSDKQKGDLIHRYKPTEITRLARNKKYLEDLQKLQVEIPEQNPDSPMQ